MRALSILSTALWLAGCAGDDGKEPTTTGDTGPTSADTDTDTDADADADTDVDTDTDTDITDTGRDPYAAYHRVLHVSRGLGPIDMVVNGNLPPVLPDLGPTSGTPWAERAPATYTFQFRQIGTPLDDAFLTEDHELLEGTLHSYVVHGPSKSPMLATFVDDDSGIAASDVRVRWSHFATTLPTLDFVETRTGTTFVDDFTYGDSVVETYPVDTMTMGLDVDQDGTSDIVFEDFNLTPGTFVHIVLLEDLEDTPFLLAHQPAGTTARKNVVE